MIFQLEKLVIVFSIQVQLWLFWSYFLASCFRLDEEKNQTSRETPNIKQLQPLATAEMNSVKFCAILSFLMKTQYLLISFGVCKAQATSTMEGNQVKYQCLWANFLTYFHEKYVVLITRHCEQFHFLVPQKKFGFIMDNQNITLIIIFAS